MTNDRSGLRFDIYERVHVADDLVGIKELDEIELVPHIRVNVEADQAVLKGNLWLTGTYAGENDGAKQTLEHLIPVEITMPLSRIDRLEDIAVDIENFDVDVLSARTLNITGVLSLRGIEMRAEDDELTSSLNEEEEMVFVHEAVSDDKQPARDPSPIYDELQMSEHVPSDKQAELHADAEPLKQEEIYAQPALHAQAELDEQADAPTSQDRIYPEEVGIPEFSKEGQDEPVFEHDVVEDGDDIVYDATADELDQESLLAQEDDSDRQPVPAADEKKETKLVFGSKKEESAEPVSQSKLLNSLFGSKETRSDTDESANGAGNGKVDHSRTDSVEWKKLFLSRQNDDRASFRRMRVCIVQKEETLETIAQRYKLNPRAIMLYNRLTDQQIAEGQLIYIPQ